MLRPNSDSPLDIEFQAEENLFKSPSGQITMLKNACTMVPWTKNRMFQSFINEFCGMQSLPSNTLRFLIESRDVQPMQVVTGACSIKVSHKPSFYESPNKLFRPALKSILEDELCADFTIKIENSKFQIRSNKCVLFARSAILAKIVKDCDEVVIPEIPQDSLKSLLEWIYSGDVDMPSDIKSLINLYFLANDFEVSDLVQRCEEEILMRASSKNVVDILVNFQDPKIAEIVIEDNVAIDDQKNEIKTEESSNKIQKKPRQLSETIVNHCKSLFISEFQEVLILTPSVEQQISSVPGLMTSLFLHINEHKSKKKKTKVRFSFAEEVATNSLVSSRFDFTDSHSEVSSARHDS